MTIGLGGSTSGLLMTMMSWRLLRQMLVAILYAEQGTNDRLYMIVVFYLPTSQIPLKRPAFGLGNCLSLLKLRFFVHPNAMRMCSSPLHFTRARLPYQQKALNTIEASIVGLCPVFGFPSIVLFDQPGASYHMITAFGHCNFGGGPPQPGPGPLRIPSADQLMGAPCRSRGFLIPLCGLY